MKTIAVLGTVGIPASYGGFETLVENLALVHHKENFEVNLVVYCSGNAYQIRPVSYLKTELRYVGINANGVASVLYDVVSLISAVRRGSDVILLLGVSGAIALPLLRLFSRVRIVINIDGIEWKRAKWRGPARWFLRISEQLAVRFSHNVIADNAGIAEYVKSTYTRECQVIAYGGDHALSIPARQFATQKLPLRFALALCRIEPENNVEMILHVFASIPDQALVFVGNWQHSSFGRRLKQIYTGYQNLYLLDPIYDLGVLRSLRDRADFYIHGHSAGGTNPSLVEMMHFGLPILAFDCIYNRYTTEEQALYFSNARELTALARRTSILKTKELGQKMLQIAHRRYTWASVAAEYFKLLMN
jgi:glycosyltransferase involved in cell wall biosynthesis